MCLHYLINRNYRKMHVDVTSFVLIVGCYLMLNLYVCITCSDRLGKEIVSRFSTDLDTNKTWYTDANGREMQKRM